MKFGNKTIKLYQYEFNRSFGSWKKLHFCNFLTLNEPDFGGWYINKYSGSLRKDKISCVLISLWAIMHRNCTYFSFKIYQLKCTIERCNFQILDGSECFNPTHVNAGHSQHPSEGIVTLVWAKIAFSGQYLLPNCHSCSQYLLKIVNDRSKSNYWPEPSNVVRV
jgi:hypothetical protein